MKRPFLSLPSLALCSMFLLFSFSSCDKAFPEEFKFDMNNMSYTFTLQPVDTTGFLVLSADNMNIDLDSALAAQNVDNYEVTALKLKSANISTATPDANFNSFENVAAFIRTPTKPETMIGEQKFVPKNQQTVPLDVNSDINLVEYARERPTTFILKGNVTQPLLNPMQIKVNMNYTVELNKK